MALQAYGEHDGPFQQARVHRTVRTVASFAAIDTDSIVLEDKRTTLVDVAFETRLFIPLGLIHHMRTIGHAPRGRGGAVRVVAIRALHEALVDAVLEGHGELRAYGGMAAVTEVGLLLREQEFWRRLAMNGMAICADDVVIGMHATPDVGAGNRLGMAEQAVIENLLGGHKRKRHGNRIAPATGGDMVRPRSVAALAARILGLLLT